MGLDRSGEIVTMRTSHRFVGKNFRGMRGRTSLGWRAGFAGALIALGCTALACDSGEPADDSSERLSVLTGASSSGDSSSSGLAPLSVVTVPQPVGGDIVDQAAAVRLGKALFWDAQAGGDGQVACASCHFHAGADSRLLDVLNPGPDGVFASGGVTSAGQLFSPSAISNDDRVGSQGVVGSLFVGVASDPATAADICTPDLSAPFFGERRVTGRNAPPVVGAVFNRDNFWDGRANHAFNGVNPFGNTPNGSGGPSIANGSLASQAVGPANNPTEMSCAGRSFNGPGSLAAKLLARQPLAHQLVSPSDGVLGALSAAPSNGLTASYQDLIAAAFPAALTADAQAQFSRIWGQAIEAYEATLVPDQTPLDRFLGGNSAAMTATQRRGLDLFTGKAGCARCHAGPELTDASVGFSLANGLVNEDGGDQGFHNLGVRPTAEDLGRAACPSAPCDSSGPGHYPNSVSRATKDQGAFKTAALRNVKLTAPYFHNGGKASLEQVVAFYNQGGDFANPEKAKRIRPLSLGVSDQAALVDFLRNGLTDCRVENQLAPFDHPALSLPDGDDLPAIGAGGTGPCP
jgi:cytochrome c peroxidase